MGACYGQGRGVAQDFAAAMWFRKAAAQVGADAQCNLGGCYLHGHGVVQDPSPALAWFRKAADQGNADAEFNLGV